MDLSTSDPLTTAIQVWPAVISHCTSFYARDLVSTTCPHRTSAAPQTSCFCPCLPGCGMFVGTTQSFCFMHKIGSVRDLTSQWATMDRWGKGAEQFRGEFPLGLLEVPNGLRPSCLIIYQHLPHHWPDFPFFPVSHFLVPTSGSWITALVSALLYGGTKATVGS